MARTRGASSEAPSGEFLLALARFDEQRLWADLEYGSLFDFLHRELRLSKSAAFYRKTAAALVREYPAVAEALRDGKLCLMTVAEVARVITTENAAELLPGSSGSRSGRRRCSSPPSCRSRPRPLARFATPVRIAPAAPALALTAPASASPALARAAVLPVELAAPGPSDLAAEQGRRPAQAPPEPPATTAEPLTAELTRLHLMVEKSFVDKLEAARDALSHLLCGCHNRLAARRYFGDAWMDRFTRSPRGVPSV